MLRIRKATTDDFLTIIDLIDTMDKTEKEYLEYHVSPAILYERIYKNIYEDHVVVFVNGNKPVGFLEYAPRGLNYIWIYSLYFARAHRKEVFHTLLPAFTLMKKAYRMPIHFNVHPENKKMQTLAKFIKAEHVATHHDKRMEYKVKEVL